MRAAVWRHISGENREINCKILMEETTQMASTMTNVNEVAMLDIVNFQ